MKYILSFVILLITLVQAQSSSAPALTTTLLFNGAGTKIVSNFQTNSAFIVDISSSAKATLSLFSAETGQKVLDFNPGQIMNYTGEFFFIIHTPLSSTTWQLDLTNQSYLEGINQPQQQENIASNNTNSSSNQSSSDQTLSNALSFQGMGSNYTTVFSTNQPFIVNFDQNTGIKLYLYSGTNNISIIEPGQILDYSGQFYIYVTSPAENTIWQLDLTNAN